jgi:hypothetical protein
MNNIGSKHSTIPASNSTHEQNQQSLPREQLKDSEREANRTHPKNFQVQEAERKTVSTQRDGQHTVGSIKGLDNEPEDS